MIPMAFFLSLIAWQFVVVGISFLYSGHAATVAANDSQRTPLCTASMTTWGPRSDTTRTARSASSNSIGDRHTAMDAL